MNMLNAMVISLIIPPRSLKLNKTDTLGLIVPNISNVFLLRWQKNSNNAVDVPDINLQSVALMMMLTMKIN